MALSDTIATIISRSKSLEICDTLHDMQIATTEEQLIQAALPLAVYGYQCGLITDTDLSSFTEALLNAYNVFTTGTFTVTNPTTEVYIMKDAVVTITLTDYYCKINVMGGGQLTLICNGKSYATVKIYDNAVANVTVNDVGFANIALKETGSLNLIENGASIVEITGSDTSSSATTSNGTSYLLGKFFQQSSVSPVINDTAVVNIKLFQNAQQFSG